MSPFNSKPQCEKCGAFTPTMQYVAAFTGPVGDRGRVYEEHSEHLRCGCFRCGYRWLMEVRPSESEVKSADPKDPFYGAPDWAKWRWTEKGGHEVWTQNRPVYGIDGMVCEGLWAYVPNDDARKVTKRVRK